MAESKEELKSLLMKVEEETKKTGLKLNIQKTKIMAFGPFMANRLETIETVNDFVFLGSKISVDGDCSHEIKRRLLLRRKAMTNLDNILKSRDSTLPTKVCIVKTISPGGGNGNPLLILAWKIRWTEESGGLLHRVSKELVT